MEKNEIIQLHVLFCETRKYLEKEFSPDIDEEKFNGFFIEYDKLKVSPVKVNRSTGEQKKAMKILGKCISDFMNSGYAAKKKPYMKTVKAGTEYALTPSEYLAAVS